MSTPKKFIVGKLNKLSAVYKWKHIVVQRILNIFLNSKNPFSEILGPQ